MNQFRKVIGLLLLLLPLPSMALGGNISGDYLVLGVIATNTNTKGVALIKNRTNERVTAVKIGDRITPQTTLSEVTRQYIVMKQGDHRYKIMVGADIPNNIQDATPLSDMPVVASEVLPSTEGIEKQGGTLKVASSIKEHLVGSNLNKVLMQAATQPYMKDGKLVGFSIWDIDQGSIYQIAGFQNGDVITHIDGQPITDAGVAIRMLQNLKKATEADVQFLRGGSEQRLKIEIQ